MLASLMASLIALLATLPASPAPVANHIVAAPVALHQSAGTKVAAASATRVTARHTVTHPPTYVAPAPTPTPTPTPVVPPTTTPDTDYASQVESLVLQYTNAQRAQNGLATLANDTRLASIARAHSVDMLQHNYFNHNDLTGCSPACRLNNAGYAWQSYGENIHWMYGYTLTPEQAAQKVVNDWMNSPGHRANILNGSFTTAGVGVAVAGTTIYSTTDYTLPR